MSDTTTTSHLQTVRAFLPTSNNNQTSSWNRKEKKLNKNYQYKQQYPPLQIPVSSYQIIYVNKYTTSELIQTLIDHVRTCREFTFDTEGQNTTQNLALIQIQTIPDTLPFFIILVELFHLPLNDTLIYIKLKQLFRLIFQPDNRIYAWGSLRAELHPALIYQFFDWPIVSVIVDVQTAFGIWYNWARSRCEVCDPSLNQPNHSFATHDTFNVICTSSSNCRCHEPSPYRINEKWGLQDALIYTYRLFIDKSHTLSNWVGGLDPHHSTLSSNKRQKMLHYALYDCFATTYLTRPVLEYWSFQQVANSNFVNLFQASTSCSLFIPPSSTEPSSKSSIPSSSSNYTTNISIKKQTINPQTFKEVLDNDLAFLSDVSDDDDDIYLNQCTHHVNDDIVVNPSSNHENDDHHFVNQRDNPTTIDTLCELISDDDLPLTNSINNPENCVNNHNVVDDDLVHRNIVDNSNTQHQPSPILLKANHRRSAEARRRRNHKRNQFFKARRYRFFISRSIYHRFSTKQIKAILSEYQISYIHIKIVDNILVIGVKNEQLQQYIEQQLSPHVFNRHNYYLHRNKYQP